MGTLYLVPNSYLHQLRRSLAQEDGSALVMTMPGLVAQILKEGLVSYKEDNILEEVAIWQSVQDHQADLELLQPIAHFSGFMEELRWLFNQLDLQEDVYKFMPEKGQAELRLLHARYHEILSEHGILPAAGQMQKALELAEQTTVLAKITTIQVRGLGELSPLEEAFLAAVAQERSLTRTWPSTEHPTLEVYKAANQAEEVEMIGKALREQIEAGVPLETLGVAFPNPRQYLPILMPVFAKLQIPWRVPSTSLRNTPLGKTLLNLVAGELEGWHKHHLQLLTAPGWGFPFTLTAEEQRQLSIAPPLKGLPAWRDRLEQEAGWQRVLQFITELEEQMVTRPLKDFGAWLEELLAELQPEAWMLPEDNLENWAELVKAWDGMLTIAQNLQEYEWMISPVQFLQLLQTLLDRYQIQARRVFSERVQIMSVEQLGAYTYEQLYVGGLVEGQFPAYKHAHWLTKTATVIERKELYERLTRVAQHIFLHYPEADREGKLNLPATTLPKVAEEKKPLDLQPVHHASLFFGNGHLEDQRLLSLLQEKILAEGLSVSALNRYANCPYQFFASYVLELKPVEEESLELEAWQHGHIAHEVLDTFWEGHLAGPLPAIDDAQVRIEALLHQKYSELGTSPTAALVRTMREFIRTDLYFAGLGFRPKYLEKWFQGLMIQTQFGPVEIKGRIDRIDLHADGSYVVFDYKTGAAPQINEMVAGKDVQIAAYLLAAQNLLPQGRNVGAAYYVIRDKARRGIFHEQHQRSLVSRRGPNVLDDEAFAQQQEKFGEILAELVSNIMQAKFPIEPISPRICRYCPFQGICRREVRS